MTNPLDYSLCCQTVTLYRKTKEGISRFVLPQCSYSYQPVLEKGVLGEEYQVKFTLIVPGTVQILPGDRVMAGEGPQVTMADWPSFIPVCVPSLAEVAYVKPCFWDGRQCHTEAGRGRKG